MVVKESTQDELERGDTAPFFKLRGADGNEYSPDDFTNYDALLVVFTCNHCPFAKAKIPVLNELAEDFDDLAVVGINPNDAEEYPDDSFEKMQDVVESGQVRYDAYLRDESQDVARAYGAACTPDPFLFARQDDEFVLVYHGRLDDAMKPDQEPSEHHMREAVEAVLSGDEVEKGFLPSMGCSIKWK